MFDDDGIVHPMAAALKRIDELEKELKELKQEHEELVKEHTKLLGRIIKYNQLSILEDE